jgi:hypothetical protein
MSVDDHGLEAIRKSAVDPAGTKVNYALQVKSLGQLVNVAYDYISLNLFSATTEIYTYKSGGSGGTTVATVTVIYTSSAKTDISSVALT